jgi:molybdopterin-containing oxidoreductase family membrane subunit
VLAAIHRFSEMDVAEATIQKLALVVTVAAQITIVMLVSEMFTEFYRDTHHGLSAKYLYFGLGGQTRLVPWIWTSIVLTVCATAVLSVHRLRRTPAVLYVCCAALIVAIEIEKGMGTIVPGFVPEPWGRIVEYSPTWVEWTVSLGILALGCFVFTVLAKAAIPIENGRLQFRSPGDVVRARDTA